MKTNMDETTSKKGKYLGVRRRNRTKVIKSDKTMKSHKYVRAPKFEFKPSVNCIELSNLAKEKSIKKQNKPENKVTKSGSGERSKLQMFLEDSRSMDSKVKNKFRRRKSRLILKVELAIQEFWKNLNQESRETIIEYYNYEIGAVVSRGQLTKNGKRKLRMYKRWLYKTGLELPTTAPEPAAIDDGNKEETLDTLAASESAEVKEECEEEDCKFGITFTGVKNEELEEIVDEGEEHEVMDENNLAKDI